ncbi:MAG: biopolymer transporter ExbD [Myxococcota bacterium]
MGFAAGGSGDGPRSDINITPLVDVCLVLLIIFMVVTPLLQKNKDVQLPTANNIETQNKEEDPLTLSITSDEKIWVGNNVIPTASVRPLVEAALKEAPGRSVLIKGDVRLRVMQVRAVMHEVQLAGARTVGLGVEKPGEE